MKIEKERIDKLLFDRKLANSREKSRALILSGCVFVNEKRIDKVGVRIPLDSQIKIIKNEYQYVSRGGLKLEHALDKFNIDVTGAVAVDIGSSTGGFTDCLLTRGAIKVFAVDVGYGQLDWKLRNDDRVIVMEGINARFLKAGAFKEVSDLAVVDVSFISLEKIIPVIIPLIKETGDIIALIKPQFEVGKGKVGKGGVVRDQEKHYYVVKKIADIAAANSLYIKGIIESPVRGTKGNREFFIHLTKNQSCDFIKDIEGKIKEIIYGYHQ